MENISHDFYPQGPDNVPAKLTKPNLAYKQRAWLAVFSLLLFIIVYIALSGWFMWTAYRLFYDGISGGEDELLSYLVGGCSAFLAIIMVKSLFFSVRGGDAGNIEITANEQPRLFEFLYRLADEAGAPRPKKVFLSSRVNASVFYDLSILNLLIPSGKNLEIGLALVNVLTLSELKAVLSHEFGHFAQRSMAIGSWVYITQQIATQLIAKRDGFDKTLRVLSNTDIRIAWIGWLLSLIVWSIRSLLDTVLMLVLFTQRALSRQMEFHADLVAVSLTGSDELVHALHKLQSADDSWYKTLNFAEYQLSQGREPSDLFFVQSEIINIMAKILDDEDYGKVPQPAEDNPISRRIFKSSFAQPPQMWSTHPANADREENAKKIYISAPHDNRSSWLLFDQTDNLKKLITRQIFGEVQAIRLSPEQTKAALHQRYALLHYDRRYRGAYLGRQTTRYADNAFELFSPAFQQVEPISALKTLYPESLSADLKAIRELEEEKVTLQALKDKTYKATGKQIVFRGKTLNKRQLSSAIAAVTQEAENVRQKILAHDRVCRTTHLAAAAKLGKGWDEYLCGLIKTLHYAEHTHANLLDAHGTMVNTLNVIMADGRVTNRELKRLIARCDELLIVLEDIDEQKRNVYLDKQLLENLRISSWSKMIENLTLGGATNENINDWLQVIDSWVNSYGNALNNLRVTALEHLLFTEDTISNCLQNSIAIDTAPNPSKVPEQYTRLIKGQERKRQTKLGLWDRFQIADGLLPATARLCVALGIVASVLGFSYMTGSSRLSIYNGLSVPVNVLVSDDHSRILNTKIIAPFSATELTLGLSRELSIKTVTGNNRVIEQFTPKLANHTQHYVYNVAAASPLVKWVQAYGSASQTPPVSLGAPRWIAASVDVYFTEPPVSVKTKSGSATRSVLTGIGNIEPEKILRLVADKNEQDHIIATHNQWDSADYRFTPVWKSLANTR